MQWSLAPEYERHSHARAAKSLKSVKVHSLPIFVSFSQTRNVSQGIFALAEKKNVQEETGWPEFVSHLTLAQVLCVRSLVRCVRRVLLLFVRTAGEQMFERDIIRDQTKERYLKVMLNNV